MNEEVLIPLGSFAMVVAIIWISLHIRMEMRKRVLDVIEKAIDKGIDPSALPLEIESGKANSSGNWKAGVLLIASGLALAPLMIIAYVTEAAGTEALPALAVPLLPIILGIGFLFIHSKLSKGNGA